MSALWIVRVDCVLVPCAGARNAPEFTVIAPEIIPLPPKVPAFTCTAPVPVPEPVVLLTTSVPCAHGRAAGVKVGSA